jgi:hypothetical protein
MERDEKFAKFEKIGEKNMLTKFLKKSKNKIFMV